MTHANHANRGMSTEEMVELANEIYARQKLAKVQKIATPMKPVWESGKIKDAFFAEKSTVDFVGVAMGCAIAFDVKSTKEKKRFPLSNIKEHQVTYLMEHQDAGGVSFLLIEFSTKGEWYIVMINDFYKYWVRSMAGGKKSIPYAEFKNFYAVETNKYVLDYLQFLRKYVKAG